MLRSTIRPHLSAPRLGQNQAHLWLQRQAARCFLFTLETDVEANLLLIRVTLSAVERVPPQRSSRPESHESAALLVAQARRPRGGRAKVKKLAAGPCMARTTVHHGSDKQIFGVIKQVRASPFGYSASISW